MATVLIIQQFVQVLIKKVVQTKKVQTSKKRLESFFAKIDVFNFPISIFKSASQLTFFNRQAVQFVDKRRRRRRADDSQGADVDLHRHVHRFPVRVPDQPGPDGRNQERGRSRRLQVRRKKSVRHHFLERGQFF